MAFFGASKRPEIKSTHGTLCQSYSKSYFGLNKRRQDHSRCLALLNIADTTSVEFVTLIRYEHCYNEKMPRFNHPKHPMNLNSYALCRKSRLRYGHPQHCRNDTYEGF